MRAIELTGTFKRDYKRETKGRHREILESDFNIVVMALAHDQSCRPTAIKLSGSATALAVAINDWL